MDNLTQTTPAPEEPVPSPPDLTGQTLGDFQVLRKLGQGGMGQVYLAEQVSLNRKVALKLLRPELAANRTALERFRLEARSVAKAIHANIVQVYQVGEASGHHYMALEFVEGRNLRDFIARKGPPEVLLALSIMRQVAAALQRASELGIIHRDIKPENILLTKKGEVKVADFGLSRVLEGDQPTVNLTQSGVTMGTPLYMSPEQVEGKPLDCRTDIYSLGVTSYHMLAGEPPFKGSTAFEVALQHVRAEPTPLSQVRPDLPAELSAIVHKMMAKEPGQRYQNGRELLKDLNRVREAISGQTGFLPVGTTSFPETAAPDSGAAQASGTSARTGRMPTRRRRLFIATLFLLSLGIAGGVGAAIAWMQQHDRSPGDDEANHVEPSPTLDASSLEDREKEREKRARAEIEDRLDPTQGFKNPELGAKLCVDYALSLLKQNRLDEADKLFKRLELIHQVELYSLVGTLGHGIVLSLRDDWRESHAALKSLAEKRKKQPLDPTTFRVMIQAMNSHPDLPRWLRETLHRNKVNSKGAIADKDVPAYLKPLLDRELPRDRPPFLPPKKTDRSGPQG